MTSTGNSIRALLTYAIILPLALMVGYMLATPLDFVSFSTVGLVLMALSVPLLMKWHHPLVFLSWNTTAIVFFMPGQPHLWLVVSMMGVLFALLQRAVVRDLPMIHAPSVILPLVFMAVVVYVTARLTGGFGLRSLGSSTIGGRRYILIFGAIAGFLVMVSRPIPPHKATLYLGLFFLGALSDAIGNTVGYVNPNFYFIYLIFPAESLPQTTGAIARVGGLTIAFIGLYWYVLARYGIKGVIGWKNLGRLLLLAAAAVLSAVGGFRSAFVLMALTFALLFYFEGLFRGRSLVALVLCVIFAGALLVPLADKLPLPIQRTLSVLPLDVDPMVRLEAKNSNDWRLQMWRALLPEIPNYLWLGKGLSMDQQDMEFAALSARNGFDIQAASFIVSGDYHSGPLTTIIPFGIWGVLGLLWFLGASIRALYLNHLYGPSHLQKINTFLLAYFVARVIHFMLVYGSFYSDFASFAGAIGLGLALNGGIHKRARVPSVAPSPEASNPRPMEAVAVAAAMD